MESGAEALALDAVVVARSGYVHRRIGEGEVVMLDAVRGRYYALNAVGARIWELVQQPVAVGRLRDALLEEFEVSEKRCEQDLLDHLRELVREGALEVQTP